jgi:hypothetical protein
MICPVEITHDMSALRAVRIGDHAEHWKMAKKITWWQAAEIYFTLVFPLVRFFDRGF